ncbi:DNA replication/repair protein RecF [Maritimibacter sp. 55A14]|uniref:DNA replication/repair protein RecF n=1 Tax=Maritimibacter sp. 55A14 TaxID=2174844 RepID=UPI000D61BE77|nr:DNA replication/repair protein RecF [Maritimibacter sp. 55A14]PWE32382.1 DNA replication/repair protein RecF [Maritimibacter sp. 55A14]
MPGLHLSALTLSHFRSHLRASLSLDARPVAIFGPNGAGKTNILEAVSLLSPGRGLRRAAAGELARTPGGIGWKVTARTGGPGAGHEIETWAEPEAPRQLRIDGKPAAQVALGRLLRVLWLVPAMDRLWIEGAEGRRRFLDRMVMSFVPEHAEAVLAYEKAMRERNRLLKDMVRNAAWYGALETQMAESGAAIMANRRFALARLDRAQRGAATAFPAAALDLAGPEGPEGAGALAAALAEGRPADLRAGRSLTGPHRTDLEAVYAEKAIAAKLCSTGEQKALLISLVLANARALAEDTGAPPVLLLDEVAAHLDADRRAALYDEIAALGAQAWMTGTGRELFADLGGRAQFLEVTAENGDSRITKEG